MKQNHALVLAISIGISLIMTLLLLRLTLFDPNLAISLAFSFNTFLILYFGMKIYQNTKK